MISPRCFIIVCCALAAVPAHGRIFSLRLRPRHSNTVSTRNRLTVNTLITEPGTFEWEWYGAVDLTRDGFTVPTTWKVTPGKESGIWSRTELSASFNALTGLPTEGRTVLQGSDHLTFAATSVIPGIGNLQLAVAPNVTFLLRGDSGERIGLTVLGKIENMLQQVGFTLSWSGATRPSDSNPAGTFDASAAYGRRLGSAGLRHKLTAHMGATWERSSDYPAFVNFSEGVELQITRDLAADVTVQHLNLGTGSVDHQLVCGVTWNLGPVRHWGSRTR